MNGEEVKWRLNEGISSAGDRISRRRKGYGVQGSVVTYLTNVYVLSAFLGLRIHQKTSQSPCLQVANIFKLERVEIKGNFGNG